MNTIARIPRIDRVISRGIRNHNPGNIDRKPNVRWQGQAADQNGDPRFVIFTEAKWGIRAIARILITYQDSRQARDGSKIDTIREIIERWAPATENDTGAYVAHVTHLASIGADQRIDVYDYATMKALVKAIIVHENGANPYPDPVIDAGLTLAGIQPNRTALIKQPDVAATAITGGIAGTGLILDTIHNTLPKATETASAIQGFAPRWVLPLICGLIVAGVIVALLKQRHDRATGAR